MTIRQVSAVKLLSSASRPLTCAELAASLSVSSSTVRNDLNEIERYLRRTGVGTLVKKPGVGITLLLEDRTCLLLSDMTTAHQEINRQFHICKRVLYTQPTEVVTEKQLSEELFLSRSSVSRELDRSAKWFSNFNLRLTKRKNRGIILDGTEVDKRLAIIELFFAQLSATGTPDSCESSSLTAAQEALFTEFAPGVDLASLCRLIRILESRHSPMTTQRGFLELLLHLALSLSRSGRASVDRAQTARLKSCTPVGFQAELDSLLIQVLNRCLPPSEKEYLSLRLLFSDIFNGSGLDAQRQEVTEQSEFNAFLQEFAKTIHSVLDVDIRQEKHLLETFRYHLSSLICRMKNGISVRNPLLHELKELYPSVFSAAWSASILFEKYYGLVVNDDEIAFLTTYLVTAQEHLKPNLDACVVCNYGVSVSGLICERLRTRLPEITVTDTLSVKRFQDLCGSGPPPWDMILSTIPGLSSPLPTVCISPLLTLQDEFAIREFAKGLRRSSLLSRTPLPSGRGRRAPPCRPELVMLDLDAKSKTEVIHLMCRLLEEYGFVSAGFDRSVLEREQVVSTEVGFGFAIPHGNPRSVSRPAIALARLKAPIQWSAGEMVDTVLLIACGAGRESLELFKPFYKMLALLLEDPVLQRQFRDTRTPDELCCFVNGTIPASN